MIVTCSCVGYSFILTTPKLTGWFTQGGWQLKPNWDFENKNLSSLFEKRRVAMMEICRQNRNKWQGDGAMKRLVVSKRYGMAFCPVPKIGSTFWSNLILENSPSDEPTKHHDRLDQANATNKPTLHLRNLDLDIGFWYLKHYKSMLFVRDPYSRLLAAYVDKFFTPNPVYWKTGSEIIQNFRKDPDVKALKCGQDVTFSEFIQHVISDVKGGRADQHWKPIYLRCSPCQIEYSIIGKLETMKTEGDFIIKKYFPRAAFSDLEKETALSRVKMNVDNFYRFFLPSMRYCMRFPEALIRLLRKLQVRGLIDKKVDLPREWKLLFTISSKDVKKFIVDAHLSRSKDAILNRKEALIEAFSTVPMAHMNTLRELFAPDFKLFGYDSSPGYLFNRNRTRIEKFYFSWKSY